MASVCDYNVSHFNHSNEIFLRNGQMQVPMDFVLKGNSDRADIE